VFLDEFEKTNKEVRQALLVPIDDGTHLDRRNEKKLDIKKTIWDICNEPCQRYHCSVPRQAQVSGRRLCEEAPMHDLAKDLQWSFKAKMGAPLICRITAIVPVSVSSTC
jgi:hypothetical protein